MLSGMLLIVAALAEELATGLNLCGRREKRRPAGIPVWTGIHRGRTLRFVKLGMGPGRSAATLECVLGALETSVILSFGYAGALDPGLKVGELVVGERADLLSQASRDASLDSLGLVGSWPLAAPDELFRLAQASGLPAHRGGVLTSPWVMGAPEHKRILFARFHDRIVDMETAALARVAAAASIPLQCVRAVSDSADDDSLSFLSYDPAAGPFQRAARGIAAGSWLKRYGHWREGSAAARRSLGRFLTCYLDADGINPSSPGEQT
jgi:adenosylhomocysteine nucleosidase